MYAHKILVREKRNDHFIDLEVAVLSEAAILNAYVVRFIEQHLTRHEHTDTHARTQHAATAA